MAQKPADVLDDEYGDEELEFQKWYKNRAEKTRISPDPDDPLHFYDYRAAHKAGAEPQISLKDGKYHWPSTYKREGHPNQFVDGIDTITGKPVVSKEKPPDVADDPPPKRTAAEHFFKAPKVVTDAAAKVGTEMDQSVQPEGLSLNRQLPGRLWDTAKDLAVNTFKHPVATWKGNVAGSLQGAAEFLNPADIIGTATGLKAASAAYQGLSTANKWRRIAQAANIPVVGQGAVNLAHPDSTIGERAAGVAQIGGGLLGMHYPKTVTPRPDTRGFNFSVEDLGNVGPDTPPINQKLLRGRVSTETKYGYPGPTGPPRPRGPKPVDVVDGTVVDEPSVTPAGASSQSISPAWTNWSKRAELAASKYSRENPNARQSDVQRAATEFAGPEPSKWVDAQAKTGKDAGASITDYLNLRSDQVTRTTTPPRTPARTAPATAKSSKLAQDLQGARPRYNFGKETYEPDFEDDLDKSLFILAQTTPSKRNADYLKFAMEQTGLPEADVIRLAYAEKKRLRDLFQGQPSGPISVPRSGVLENIRNPKPPPEAEPITEPSGSIQPITPSGAPAVVEPPIKKPFVNPFLKQPEVKSQDLTVPKQDLAVQDKPLSPSAKFAYWWESGMDDIPNMAQWHVKGGDYDGSHIGIERMRELGIPTGDYPLDPGLTNVAEGPERLPQDLSIRPPEEVNPNGTAEDIFNLQGENPPIVDDNLKVGWEEEPGQTLSPPNPAMETFLKGIQAAAKGEGPNPLANPELKEVDDSISRLKTLDANLETLKEMVSRGAPAAEIKALNDKIKLDLAKDVTPPLKKSRKALKPTATPSTDIDLKPRLKGKTEASSTDLTAPKREPRSKNSPANDWLARIKELDDKMAPDIRYRDILSTSGKNELKKGETWRARVLSNVREQRAIDARLDAEDAEGSRESSIKKTDDKADDDSPREYEDLTPDRYKRYKVYDSNDKLIHETTDYDEAHRMADEEDGYVKDIDEPPQAFFSRADKPQPPQKGANSFRPELGWTTPNRDKLDLNTQLNANRNQNERARALGIDPTRYNTSDELSLAIHDRRNELGMKPDKPINSIRDPRMGTGGNPRKHSEVPRGWEPADISSKARADFIDAMSRSYEERYDKPFESLTFDELKRHVAGAANNAQSASPAMYDAFKALDKPARIMILKDIQKNGLQDSRDISFNRSNKNDHTQFDGRVGESGMNFNAPDLRTFLAEAPVQELNRVKDEIGKRLKFLDGAINDHENRFIKGKLNRSIILGKRKLTAVEEAIESRGIEEPSAMRVPNTGTKDLPNIAIGGADEGVIDALSESLYTRNPDVIAAKELIQNSNDEHRISGKPGEAIRIATIYGTKNPITGADSNSIAVRDKGRGLTPDQLYTVFTDISKSGKGDDDAASGGFGFAKASPLAGGDYVVVESYVKEKGDIVKYTFEGNPAELKKQDEGVPVERYIVSPKTSTGMRVQVWYDKDRSNLTSVENIIKSIGAKSFNSSPIEFLKSYDDTDFNSYLDDPNFAPVYSSPEKLVNKPAPPLIDTLDLPNATVKIHYTQGDPDEAFRSYELNILNKGLWQQGLQKSYGSMWPVAGVPKEIAVDIISKIKEGKKGYPFGLNREQLQEDPTMQAINKWIQDNVVTGALAKHKDRLQRLYDGMPTIQIGSTTRPSVFFDSGGRLTSSELDKFTNSPIVKELGSIIDYVVNDILEARGEQKWIDKVEKTGTFLVPPGFFGLHAPNPGTNWQNPKSIIVANMFAHATEFPDDPIAAAEGIITTLQHEVGHVGEGKGKNLQTPSSHYQHRGFERYDKSFKGQLQTQGGGNPGHETDWLQRLGDIYATYSPGQFDDAVEHVLLAITDSSGNYSPEFQELLQIYQDSRGRAETTEDLLSRTGVKSKSTRGGKGDIPGDDKSDGKRAAKPRGRGKPKPNAGAVSKLIRALEEAIPKRKEQAQILRKERARKFAAYDKIKGGGEEGAKLRISKMRGEHTKVEGINLNISNEERGQLFDIIDDSNITSAEKLQGSMAVFKLLNGEGVPQRNELELLDRIFGAGFGNQIIEMHGGLGMVRLNVIKTANTMKALMSSLDLSGPLRQGIGLAYRKEWYPAFGEMFKYLASKEYYDGAMEALRERPTYLLGREVGLFMAEPNNLTSTEEAFMDNLIPNLPGVSHSERAYTGFLNKVRADVFDALLRNAQMSGSTMFTIADGKIVPTQAAFDLAHFINRATGRGHLGRFEKIAAELNTLMWSPRLLQTRIENLNPWTYINPDTDPFVRKESIKSLLGIASSGMLLLGIAALYGKARGEEFKINMDPTNSDFGKIRFGEKIHDPWNGHQQVIVAAVRFINGFRKGKPIEGASAVGRFGINKLSPAASLAHEIMTAKTLDNKGNLVDQYNNKSTVPKEVAERFSPMFIQGLTEVLTENPDFIDGAKEIYEGKANASNLPHAIPSIFGAGVQTYPEPSNGPRLRRPGVSRLSP